MIDPRTYRLVVLSVAGTLTLCILGIVILSVLERPIPDILENVTVGALTGIVGLLASPRSGEPQQVVVGNTAANPVPVEGDTS